MKREDNCCYSPFANFWKNILGYEYSIGIIDAVILIQSDISLQLQPMRALRFFPVPVKMLWAYLEVFNYRKFHL